MRSIEFFLLAIFFAILQVNDAFPFSLAAALVFSTLGIIASFKQFAKEEAARAKDRGEGVEPLR